LPPARNVALLQTARLWLRPAVSTDLPYLHRLWNEPAVGRFLWDGEPVCPERAQAVLATSAASFAAEGFGLWMLVSRADGLALGFCALRHPEGSSAVELLYAVQPAHCGRGLATEASRAVLAYAFDTLGLAEVEAGANPANVGSWRVLEKLGMTLRERRRTAVEELLLYVGTAPAP
jgi:ribosomal-protein-alanine N-acetyltransferase